MRTLIVGLGALGGIVAARLAAAGVPASLAVRNAESAATLKKTGLRVTGIGGHVTAEAERVDTLDGYRGERFDLVVLATKAQDALDVAPALPALLSAGGCLLPIQNGGVAHMLADLLGPCVVGGLSNLGATMTAPGEYEQRNAGHLLIGELTTGESERTSAIRDWLGRAVEIRVTPNLSGAVWSKLLINCSVTTIGAVAGRPMCEYVLEPDGRELFEHTYDEALSVALASGARPERMVVDPIPPGWHGPRHVGEAYDAWVRAILNAYGNLKPSMLQDLERGRTTEIDFINGYVANVGRQFNLKTPLNDAIVDAVHSITRQELRPDVGVLTRILRQRPQ